MGINSMSYSLCIDNFLYKIVDILYIKNEIIHSHCISQSTHASKPKTMIKDKTT